MASAMILSYEMKYRVILGRHVVTELLLERMHVERMHQVEVVLSHLQKSFLDCGSTSVVAKYN